MQPTIAQLIFIESGGFAGLQRGCTVVPAALPEAPRQALQHLMQTSSDAAGDELLAGAASSSTPARNMPDMQLYTLELVFDNRSEGGATQERRAATPADATPAHRVMQMPASDVPPDLAELIGFLREHARPL
jgi:hypothetical protein